MKRLFLSLGLCIGILFLASWGFKGHRAIAGIAQQHLSGNAAYVVSAYLNGQSMADVSTWADENRNNTTAPWHFLNLPLGLSHEQFVQAVLQSDNNVYTAILKSEATLKDKNIGPQEKNEALKYLIHLVGDAHQPMHISRKEDKGGNTIQVRFDNKGTNLHSLWDSKLIDHEGLSETAILQQYDTATPAEIRQWQSDSPMEWIWESYQVSSRIYAGIKPGQDIDEAYYQQNIPVIRRRIDQAGIRLAGELNKLFSNVTVSKTASAEPDIIKPEEAKDMTGKTVAVQGKIFSVKDIGSMVLANMGAAYPNQLLTLAIKGDAKQLGALLEGKTVTVKGTVIDYKGKPEIVVTDSSQISVQP